MSYIGIYRALYDHEPQTGDDSTSEAELAIKTGDLLYIVEKDADANWWKARKKAADEEEDEPEGLVPKTYIEEAKPVGKARALYEYTRQTEEELSFSDGAILDVFDASEQDWTLVGLNGDFGFVPANYIDFLLPGAVDATSPQEQLQPPSLPARPSVDRSEPVSSGLRIPRDEVVISGDPTTTTTLTEVTQSQLSQEDAAPASEAPQERTVADQIPRLPIRPSHAHVLSEISSRGSSDRFRSEQMPLPSVEKHHAVITGEATRNMDPERERERDGERAGSGGVDQERGKDALDDEQIGRIPGKRVHRDNHRDSTIQASPAADHMRVPGGFHLYNINEMVSLLGKKKKMPSTLGINIATRMILIAPEHASDGPPQEWSAEKMTHHSREGKHVFLELVRPSRSIDFHAGAKDTAEEIVNALGELAGIIRADGLRDVIMAADARHKKGVVLYDFVAQGDDEVTVRVGDEVVVVDDSRSEEWWSVRRAKNGKEGVVPSSYIEVTGPLHPSSPTTLLTSVRSTVEQNRMDEKRLANEAIKANSRPRESSPMSGQHPERGASSSQKQVRSKPDASRLRSWTDRSKSFSVEAQFLGLKDGKINLHKANGVKIAVPLNKMSLEDIEHIERVTGLPLTSEKADARNISGSSGNQSSPQQRHQPLATKVGVSIEQPRKSEYDWFQFFLSCEIAVGLCERYAQAFIRDSMDESVLPDVDAVVLRTLGLREGDIIKVMRALDAKFGRVGKRNATVSASDPSTFGGDSATGGLFSGPGGTLRNNTKKERPVPAIRTGAVVDPNAFSVVSAESDTASASKHMTAVSTPITPGASEQNAPAASNSRPGFDDDAWDVKPSQQQQTSQPQSQKQGTTDAAEVIPAMARINSNNTPPAHSASMQELSLLTEPLQPTQPNQDTQSQKLPLSNPTGGAAGSTASGTASMGANPAFFSNIGLITQSSNPLQPQQTAASFAVARQRPSAPQTMGVMNPLMPPPPQRPLSAPQSVQPSAFAPPPLAPQMTGYHTPVAPPGQSLNELGHMQYQQQPLLSHMASFSMAAGVPGSGVASQYPQAPMITGAHFAPSMQSQQTGVGLPFPNVFTQPHSFQSHIQPMATGGVNSYLPPALEPDRTGTLGIQSRPPGVDTLNMPTPLPLQPQKTGPPPDVRFGVTAESKKLTSQPTGRRANLSQATPENPFGF